MWAKARPCMSRRHETAEEGIRYFMHENTHLHTQTLYKKLHTFGVFILQEIIILSFEHTLSQNL